MKAFVTATEDSKAAPGDLFLALLDLESLPARVGEVERLTIERAEELEGNRLKRVVIWEVRLRGALLRWTESSVAHRDRLLVEFHQVEGDLSSFDGRWWIEPRPTGCRATLEAEVDIGVPLLAPMLNPVAVHSLQTNFCSMVADLSGTPT